MSGHNDITVGIAGLGTMGLPMAENLLKAGFTVVGYDVRPLKYFPGVADHMTTDPSDFAVRAFVRYASRDAPSASAEDGYSVVDVVAPLHRRRGCEAG